MNRVGGFQIKVVLKEMAAVPSCGKLFFINLGGYQPGKLEEQHYTVLCVHEERTQAVRDARQTVFFKINTFKGAESHIDEKYGIDVDDIYRVEDILAPELKNQYRILIVPAADTKEDRIHLGYLKLDKIK